MTRFRSSGEGYAQACICVVAVLPLDCCRSELALRTRRARSRSARASLTAMPTIIRPRRQLKRPRSGKRRLLQKSRHHRQGLRCVGGRWPQALRAERLRQRASPWRRAEHRVEALLQTPSLDRHQPFLPSQIQAPITQSLPPSSWLISQYFQAAAQESGPPLAAGMLMP